MTEYVTELMARVKTKNPAEPEFHQAVQEVVESLTLVLERHPEYRKAKILERMIEPERVIMFRVPWQDDKGEIQVNRGFRIEMNSAIGPYKGRAAFPSLGQSRHPEVPRLRAGLQERPHDAAHGRRQGRLRFRSERQERQRSHALLPDLHDRTLPPHRRLTPMCRPATSASAAREIGFLFGMYKRLRNEFTGVLTGKGLGWGGSLIRPEATGYGAVYFAAEMLKTRKEGLEGNDLPRFRQRQRRAIHG